MAAMTARFVRQENVRHYRRLLETVMDEAERQKILRLLAEEQEKQRAAGDPIIEDAEQSTRIFGICHTEAFGRGDNRGGVSLDGATSFVKYPADRADKERRNERLA
jgi:hypothetical protein